VNNTGKNWMMVWQSAPLFQSMQIPISRSHVSLKVRMLHGFIFHIADGDWSGLYALYEVCVQTLLHPLKTFKVLRYKGKAKDSIILLVMQKSEAFIHFEWRRKWYRLFQNSITAVQRRGYATHRFIPCG
jgi:hypothetical protein